MDADPKRTKKACRIYKTLLCYYPLSFQQEYGDTLAQQFRDEYRDVLASEKRLSLLRFWCFILVDFLRSLLIETQEEVLKMVKKNFYSFTAITAGLIAFTTFFIWFGPGIEMNFFLQLLLFPVLYILMSSLTLFGIVKATGSHFIFKALSILLLLSALLFFPIPHMHPARGRVYSTAIEFFGGNEDSAFGLVFPAYFIMLLMIAVVALVKRKWVPGISLLVPTLPILVPYIGMWLSIEIPFFASSGIGWFAVLYCTLAGIAWFVIAGWLYKKNTVISLQNTVEAA